MPDLELIHERLAPINAAMPQVLTAARSGAVKAMDAMGLPRRKYRALYANNFIGCARHTMPDVLEECAWKINAAYNCMQLTDGDTGLKIRLLKRFAIEGNVPPSGGNKARMQAWSQSELIGGSSSSSRKPLEGVHLVLIWHEENEQLSCAAYLPKEAGSFPHSAKAEMVMKVPVTLPADEFEGLRFATKEPAQTLTPVRNTVVEHARIKQL